MNPPDLSIWAEIDLPEFPQVDEAQFLRLLRASALRGAETIRSLWETRARELQIRRSGAYVHGISGGARIGIVEESESEDRYEIVVEITNTAAHASIVEDGHAAFHLPSKINWASADGSIKRTRAGEPYLVIPFRHFAFVPESERKDADGGGGSGSTRHALKNMMPREVYAEAVKMERSFGPTGGAISEERSAPAGGVHQSGRHVPEGGAYQQHKAAGRYKWAKDARDSGGGPGKLSRPAAYHRPGQIIGGKREAWIETSGPKGDNPSWGGSKFEGMRRMGPKGHTQYMTFRVITPKSEGWNIPAQAGHHIAAQVGSVVGEHIGPFIESQFEQYMAGAGL